MKIDNYTDFNSSNTITVDGIKYYFKKNYPEDFLNVKDRR